MARRSNRPRNPAPAPAEARTFRTQKLGRPPLPPGEALTATFTVRLRPEEKRRFEDVAKKAGLSLTQWARARLNEIASAPGRPSSK